jgi:small subunit ribosomal protein S18
MDQIVVDFKQPDLLKKFMTERGRILARRLSGNCAKHQRQLATAIKRARAMLLVR